MLEANQTITAEVCCNQLEEMYIHLSKMRPALVNQRSLILQRAALCWQGDDSENHKLGIRDLTTSFILPQRFLLMMYK